MIIQLTMSMVRGSLGLSAAVLGLAALAFSIVRKQRESDAVRNLRRKVVLITGGSRGLGFAIAREVASLGARLVLTARDAEELARAKAHLVSIGVATPQDVMVQAADASVPGEIQDLIAAATAYFGHIDVVVNNAGIILVGPAESQTVDSFSMAMNINFFAALHTTLAVLPQMLARGEGAIVNIASIGGKVAFPHLLPYVASKFALVGWSQGLRAEMVGKGIQVVTVTPGIMRTGSRKVLRALTRGSADVSIGLQAIVAARLSNIAPGLTARLLSLANDFLPGHLAGVGSGRSVGGRAFAENHKGLADVRVLENSPKN